MELSQELRQRYNIHVKPEWCASVSRSWEDQPTSANRTHEEELQLLFVAFLNSDLNVIGSGGLPRGLKVSDNCLRSSVVPVFAHRKICKLADWPRYNPDNRTK